MATLTADQGYAIAYEHYRNARYAEAERLCQQVLTAAPEHVESWMLYALMAHRFGRTAEGDHLLDMAVRNKQASIRLDAEYDVRPRWAPHAGLNAMLQAGLPRYAEVLRSFESFLPWLDKIAFDADPLRPADPCWNNIWLPVLDAAALYCLIAQKRPRYYVEVGSGNSTRFAARAIADHGLATRIVSIDPQPRADRPDKPIPHRLAWQSLHSACCARWPRARPRARSARSAHWCRQYLQPTADETRLMSRQKIHEVNLRATSALKI